jgi:hypothetical protein
VKYGNVNRETPYPEEVAWIKRKMKPNEGRTAGDGAWLISQ